MSAGAPHAAPPDQALQIPEPSTEELIERASDGQIVGLSGLSEMMRQVPQAADGASPPPAGIVRTPGGTRTRGGEAARQTARRRSARMLYGLLAGFVLFMAAVGGGLWYIMITGDVETPFSRPDASGGAAPSDQPPEPLPYYWLAEYEASDVPPPQWRPVNRPHDYQYHPSIAWLSDQARVFTQSAEEHFVASVVSDTPGVITTATAHLTLVSTDQRTAVAEVDIPVALFGHDRRQTLRVAMPQGMSEGLMSVDGWVEVHETFEEGVYLSQAEAELIYEEPQPTLRVSAVNPSDEAIGRAVFLVAAEDARERILGRWRVEVARPTEPGKGMEFRLRLPAPPDLTGVAAWVVEAAGE